jgi:hypothetical protein
VLYAGRLDGCFIDAETLLCAIIDLCPDNGDEDVEDGDEAPGFTIILETQGEPDLLEDGGIESEEQGGRTSMIWMFSLLDDDRMVEVAEDAPELEQLTREEAEDDDLERPVMVTVVVWGGLEGDIMTTAVSLSLKKDTFLFNWLFHASCLYNREREREKERER